MISDDDERNPRESRETSGGGRNGAGSLRKGEEGNKLRVERQIRNGDGPRGREAI